MVIQQGCENSRAVRWPYGLAPLLCAPLPCASLPLSAPEGLFSSAPVAGLQCFCSTQGNTVFSVWWKGKVHSWARGELAYIDTSSSPLAPTPWLVYPSCKWELLTVWLVQKARPYRSEWSCSDWLVEMLMEIMLCHFIGWRILSSFVFNRILGTPQGLVQMVGIV